MAEIEMNGDDRCDKASPVGDSSSKDGSFPAVMACGYRQIKIPKSGNCFPAFLIAFPNEQKGERRENDVGGDRDDYCSTRTSSGGAKSTIRSTTYRSIRFAWRSKREMGASTSSQAQGSAAKCAARMTAIGGRRLARRRSRCSREGNICGLPLR